MQAVARAPMEIMMQQRDNRMMRQRLSSGRGRPLPHRNGPSRGNARQKYETYLVRAREAQLAGDAVEMENCYQHAEHYWRVMRDAETAR
jgi:hypothetical protein